MIPAAVRIVAGAAGALVLVIVGALLVASRAWERATAGAVRRLRDEGLAAPAPPAVPTKDELGRLPAPVARYFAFALGSEPSVRLARLQHEGEFRSRPGARAARFTSVQNFSVRPRGFVWDAAIAMMPLVPVRIRDSYLGGEGGMRGRIGGLVPVVDQAGTPELASGALARWLGEAVWFPSALLPGDGLAWEAVDGETARATLTDRGTTVSMLVHFGAAGEIVRLTADRYRDVDGHPVLTPWIVELGSYAHMGGMMVPQVGSVSWDLPEGRQEYWKARIVDAAYVR